MEDIRFYHLQRQTLEEALPKLMAKVAEAGMRAVIKADEQATVDTLDKVLWDFDPASFLPHDKDGCDHPEDQAFFLTKGDTNPNGASVLVLVDGASCDDFQSYARCLYMFDGRNEDVVAVARKDWKKWKDGDWAISYWQQKEMGGWEQKA